MTEWITQEALKHSSAKLFPANTVLIAMYGDGSTIGSLGFVDTSISSNQACCALITNPDLCDPWYLFYALMDRRRDLIRLAHGGAQRNLSCRIIGEFAIPIPSVDVQKRIVKILRPYDELIENNKRRIGVIEETAQRIFEEWFVRFNAPGGDATDFVESLLGLIPSTWRIGNLKEIVVLQRGFDLPTNQRTAGPFPVIAATGVHGSHVEGKVKGPGVVTGRSGSLGTVLHIEGDYWPLNTTLWGKEYPSGSTYLAFYVLRGMNLRGLNGGAAVPTLNRNDVHRLPVAIPPARLIGKFDELVAPMFKFKKVLDFQSRNLLAQRDLLLAKLISGEIDTSRREDIMEAAE